MNWGAVFIRAIWMLMAAIAFLLGIAFVVGAVMMFYAGPGVVVVQGQPVTGVAAAVVWYVMAAIFGFVGIVFMFAGVIVFLFNLVLIIYEFWIGLIRPLTAQITAGAGFGQNAIPAPGLPGFPPDFLGNPANWLQFILLPADQRGAIPPHLLLLVNCMRRCLCQSLCGDSRSLDNSGAGGDLETAAEIAKSMLEDLKEQLRIAREKLEEALNQRNVAAIKYWNDRIAELTKRITELGG